MIGLLETKEGRRLAYPHSKLTSSAVEASKPSGSFSIRKCSAASLAALRPASASVCLSAGYRLAFRHDTHDVCSQNSRALPS
jgi:hypothetical protein